MSWIDLAAIVHPGFVPPSFAPALMHLSRASCSALRRVLSSSFYFDTSPHELRFTFDQDVSASLSNVDLELRNLFTATTVSSSAQNVSWNATTKTATFTFPGLTGSILPDGNFLGSLSPSGITNVLKVNRNVTVLWQ